MKIYLASWPAKKDPGAWKAFAVTEQAKILMSFWWLMQERKENAQEGAESYEDIFGGEFPSNGYGRERI